MVHLRATMTSPATRVVTETVMAPPTAVPAATTVATEVTIPMTTMSTTVTVVGQVTVIAASATTLQVAVIDGVVEGHDGDTDDVGVMGNKDNASVMHSMLDVDDTKDEKTTTTSEYERLGATYFYATDMPITFDYFRI
ncbi:hypothetical protein PI124_g18957 [Phytophthora idaei]|nr:hypothetical protein PI125_g20554 [Phytophthora idaei]KAG3236023.1 hypothetical protein PI124_g18957 [Phytophthora idaei]